MSTSLHTRNDSHASTQPPQTPSTQSHFATSTAGRDFESDFGHDLDIAAGGSGQGDDAVHFVLLAEFDIDAGATLSAQYPYPTGTDEHRMAELMLPDGAHMRFEDWTVFYLGQTASSAISPLLSHEEQSSSNGHKRQSTVSSTVSAVDGGAPGEKPKRGTPGGGLLYVLNCVRMKEDSRVRRGALVKAMAICSPYPYIQIFKASPRYLWCESGMLTVQPLLLLALEEYFMKQDPRIFQTVYECANGITTIGMPLLTRHEKIMLRQTERKLILEERYGVEVDVTLSGQRGGQEVLQDLPDNTGAGAAPHRPSLESTKSGSSSSVQVAIAGESGRMKARRGVPRDTHMFEAEALFKGIAVPIRIPMTVFEEDVGDYSIIELISTFSHNVQPFPGPYHPYLHTNGANTHPVILLLNALLAHKRVLFLGHGLPAHNVARMVLAACAMASGSGQILRGFTESAFPYANLASLDILEEFQGYVAGVCNPRFEDLTSTWDVLCNLETGLISVSKDLKSKTLGSLRSGRSSESSLSNSIVKVDDDPQASTPAPTAKMASQSRADCIDNQFMEDLLAAMNNHFGEAHIRLRMVDFVSRFVRLAAYSEYAQLGKCNIGYPSAAFRENKLGSGIVFVDETTKQRELRANVHRIDAWRRTKSYKLYAKDWAKWSKQRPITGFDVQHQIARLRLAKNMGDSEAEAIFSALAQGVRSYEQVVELLTYLPHHLGGLLHISNGLFHRWPGVREAAVDLLLSMQQYPVGRQAVASMNYFHRKAFLHLLERRDMVETARRQFEEQIRISRDSPSSDDLAASPKTARGGDSPMAPVRS